jgi:hypothetical protein
MNSGVVKVSENVIISTLIENPVVGYVPLCRCTRSESSRKNRDRVAKKMTRIQINEAKKLAIEWLEKYP